MTAPTYGRLLLRTLDVVEQAPMPADEPDDDRLRALGRAQVWMARSWICAAHSDYQFASEFAAMADYALERWA